VLAGWWSTSKSQAPVVIAALKKGDTPTVRMLVGDACALGKTGKTEHGIGGMLAIESEQLAHGDGGIPLGHIIPG